jgi:hypothetical protein
MSVCVCVIIHEMHYCLTTSSKALLYERYENPTNGFEVDTRLQTDGHSRQQSELNFDT